MTLEEISTPEKEKEIAHRLCEAYCLYEKVLKPYRSPICLLNDNSVIHPFRTIKLLNDWADRYMTDALRAKVAELLDGIPDNVDALFYTANSLARHEYGCMMPWYLCRPEYELKNYEKEYKSK